MKIFSYRSLRIVVLLMILAAAAIYTQEQRLVSRGWYTPLHVTIYPINADGDAATADYIAALSTDDFADIDAFMARESERYDIITSTPTTTRPGAEVEAIPPAPPASDANVVNVMLWSLRLRLWALWSTSDDDHGANGVRMFMLYHAPKTGQRLAHSLGLEKGLLGVVHAFAAPAQTDQNNIVIAHELLHMIGATDKYAPGGAPLYPHGYAEPDRKPQYPQTRAEIMAVRIPHAPNVSQMAASLRFTVVGEQTAREINWSATD
ncbi:MAG: hypothetical protein ACR2KU_09100 [Gammaproteobacteria bacterium]